MILSFSLVMVLYAALATVYYKAYVRPANHPRKE